MKTIAKTCWQGLWCVSLCLFTSSCDSGIPEMPDHVLDVEFQYELTCADALLKYVTPEVTITDGTGSQYIISIESNMWEGVEHKTWKQSVRYDSLNVASTATVRYVKRMAMAGETITQLSLKLLHKRQLLRQTSLKVLSTNLAMLQSQEGGLLT